MDTGLLLSRAPAPTEGAGASQFEDFDSLVRTHQPRIFRFLLASLRDRDLAENLTQDCFIHAYRARNQFRGAASIATWLMQIAANLLRDYHASSRMKFWRRAISRVDPADLCDWIPDQHVSPEAMTLAKEQVSAIWKAVARLSVNQRTVFLLRFVEDMDLLEIARITGMKEGTVKTHLFRALHSVRARLEETK
jgi:RNA polymerase sigma-70 factor, ECF subfamily